MAVAELRTLQGIYRRAKGPEDLPWHRKEPPALLQRLVAERKGGGRVLDVGCGAGIHAAWLAQRGYRVTGVDVLDEALQMARERTRGLPIELVQADVLAFEAPEPFDLVLDSGCFHSLSPAERPAYRRQLLRWLRPRSDYLLVHFGKRHPLDWRPIGPRRRRRGQILRELGPDLMEKVYVEEIYETPFPVGPRCLVATYWFERVLRD